MTRRGFLHDLGSSTLAITVLGTALVACGGDDGDEGEASTTTASEAAAPSDVATDAGEELRFERASFDFVSAYVLARGERAAIVDTGLGDLAPIEGALRALGTGFDRVEEVVVTHLHPDHVGGLDALAEAASDAAFHAGEADIAGITTVADLRSLAGGEDVFGLQVIATPGHTAGHVSVFDPESGVLVAGDALNLSTGELTGSAPEFTADQAAADASVRTLSDLQVEAVLAGHGDPLTNDAGVALEQLAASL